MTDSSREAQELQDRILEAMSPGQRFVLAFEMGRQARRTVRLADRGPDG
jgi:hypothetical protein